MAKIIVIGGFLGAGKTTSICSMAKRLMASGRRVGIVTNDQGSRLVDEQYLRANGLEVLSVEGGCFCCNFDIFAQKAAQLERSGGVDIILAEPVGSCTDLIATIFHPLLDGRSSVSGFSLSPLSVVADPVRVRRFMSQQSGFATEVNYLFDKQLQEADIIAVNKCDTIGRQELDEICAFLRQTYPAAAVLCASAKTGEGIDDWLSQLTGSAYADGGVLDIDYDVYARAEAVLGWLNASCTLASDTPRDINAPTRALMSGLQAALHSCAAQIAHIKCYCAGQGEFYKASITDNDSGCDESAVMSLPKTDVSLILNARVSLAPDTLRRIYEQQLTLAFAGFGITGLNIECFRPAPPNPTYRMG